MLKYAYIMSEVERKPEAFHYDMSNASLIVGQAAYEQAIETSLFPEDIVPLPQALTSDDVVKAKPLDVKKWEFADHVAHVGWLAKEVVGDDDSLSVNEGLFTAAFHLGIGPSSRRIRRSGGLNEMYLKAGVENVYTRGMYNDWSLQDFASYVGGIARQLPKTESIREKITENGHANLGPSPKIIKQRAGSIGSLLMRDGLVDPSSMSREDYIEWGVKFYLANDGLPLDTSALKYLGSRRLAPWRGTIARNFGSIESFRLEVEPLYQIEVKERAEKNSRMFSETMQNIHSGELPTKVIADATCFEDMARASAQHLVVGSVLPDMQPWMRADIARMRVGNFMTALIREGKGFVSAANIEETAEVLGVFDYIWPFDSYMQALRLPERI